MWYVYLIRCLDGSLYCGITNNPPKRFALHQQGRAAAYTRMRGAESMRIVLRCASRSEALKAEAALKKRPRAEKLACWAAGEEVAECG